MLELGFTVGLPLSGKSTYLDGILWAQKVCPDDVRLALGHEFYGPMEPVVWSIVETSVKAHLIRRQNVIVDATNITKWERSKWIRMAHEFYYHPVAYLAATHWTTCVERAKKDNKKHMIPVIFKMRDKAQPIEHSEGVEIRRMEVNA